VNNGQWSVKKLVVSFSVVSEQWSMISKEIGGQFFSGQWSGVNGQ
jgi:hypothetical protein